jgi:hypothetical protein
MPGIAIDFTEEEPAGPVAGFRGDEGLPATVRRRRARAA